MRITGGEYCSRTIKVPSTGEIRPTQDRVRESLFAILSPELSDAQFADLFSGSGSVGIEALSRGAANVTFVESSRKHVAILESNLKVLKVPQGKYRIVPSSVDAFVSVYNDAGFSIVFADPPYALWRESGCEEFLATLAKKNVVRVGGLFVAEIDFAAKANELDGWTLLRDRTYGKTRILIWRRIS
jgi:16S rRNA (guanine966-N2)-methyltransferase